jgi:hypothetical protein
LFAIVIKMPTLHRLSCFRDDLVFFVFLYQRWVYRVDYSRVNEFGQSGDDDAEVRVMRLDSSDSIEDAHVERIRALLGKLDRFSRAKAGGPARDSPTGHGSSNSNAQAGAGAGTGTPARRLSSQQRWGQLRAAAFMLGQQRLTEARERKFDDDLGALLGKLERSVSSSGAKQKKGGAGARKRIK